MTAITSLYDLLKLTSCSDGFVTDEVRIELFVRQIRGNSLQGGISNILLIEIDQRLKKLINLCFSIH